MYEVLGILPAQSELDVAVVVIKAISAGYPEKSRARRGVLGWEAGDAGPKFTLEHGLAGCPLGSHSSAGNANFLT